MNPKSRFLRTTSEKKLILTVDDIERMSVDEINARLVETFRYDDFRWQKEKGIKISCDDRAVGLEKILYQCPRCGREFKMESSGITLRCKACGKEWTMTELGELEASDGETEFSHIPDWYEWERENVRLEVTENRYSTGDLPVTVESLPNARGYIKLGSGTMTHDMNGFSVTVTGEDGTVFTMEKSVPSLYSCHIEYEYLFSHGDCVDLNTLDDTWYIYPRDCEFSVTKIALATEELYYEHRRRAGRPCKPGLA